MLTRRFVCFLALILLVCSSISAQTSPTDSSATEKDKAAKELEKSALGLIDQVTNDAATLKLWENRALIAALAGDLLWEKDKKRARELFRNSANELTQANALPPDNSKSDESMFIGIFSNTSPRRTILQTIAKHDADLALQYLLETRPPKLQEAINAQNQSKIQQNQPKTPGDIFSNRAQQFQVQQEISLEQSFASRAAEQDPKKAAQLLRDSLSKGVTNEAFGLLEKIHKKDPELAKQLTGEVVAKLLEADFAKDLMTRSVALQFLRKYGSTQSQPATAAAKSGAAKSEDTSAPFKIDEKLLKDMANKFADYLLTSNGFDTFFAFSTLMPMLERYLPEKLLQLKQKQLSIRKQMPQEMVAMEESFGSMMDGNKGIPLDKTIKYAATLPAFARRQAYNMAIDKMVAEGNGEKARSILQSGLEGKERDDALAYLDSRLAGNAMDKGNLEEAQKIINQIGSDKEKVEQLVNLAVKIHQKNTKESHEAALKVMDEARRLINEFAENKDEVAGVMKLAAGYAAIEPDRSFPLVNPLIEQANDVINATAILAKYNKREQMFRQGEMLLSQALGYGGGNFARYGKELKLLAQADYGKIKNLIDQFRRDDVRVLLRMLLAQSILSDKIGFEGGGGFTGFDAEEGGNIIIAN